MKKLNLGAGKMPLKGYVNVDRVKFPGIDVVCDLNKYPWPFKNNEFDEIVILGTLNLLDNFLKSVEEIHRISKKGAKITIKSALFPSPTCAQDPLNKTFISLNSFEYFDPRNKGLDYYSKAKFFTRKKTIIVSENKYLKWLSFFPNINQKFYYRFLFLLFPSNTIIHQLETVK